RGPQTRRSGDGDPGGTTPATGQAVVASSCARDTRMGVEPPQARLRVSVRALDGGGVEDRDRENRKPRRSSPGDVVSKVVSVCAGTLVRRATNPVVRQTIIS